MVAAVSLVPSATEIVLSLGAADSLVAVSDDCLLLFGKDAPPVVSRQVLSEVGAPRALDEAVRRRVAAGEGLYRLDEDALAELRPDVVFAQDECGVCAVPSSLLVAALGATEPCRVISLDPSDLGQVFESFETVASALDLDGKGSRLADACRDEIAHLLGVDRPERVLVLDWPEPAFAAGNWVPELVAAVGATRLGPPPGTPSREIELGELLGDADVVVVAPCGLPLADSAREAARLARRHRRRRLRWCALDGRHLFSRPGPGLVAGAALLASFLERRPLPAEMAVELES